MYVTSSLTRVVLKSLIYKSVMLSKHISGSCQQNPLYRDGMKQTCVLQQA